MTKNHDALLAKAWVNFCGELKSAGDIAFRPTAPGNPTDRATAVRMLSRNIALALAFELENADPRFPELTHYFDPMRKQGGDNCDGYYVGAPINGVDTYRISGDRGTARYFAATVIERGPKPWGGPVTSAMFGHEIAVDADGHFELILSPQPHPGNWLKTTPDTYRITIRQFFADWENEQPMEARIDRLTGNEPIPELQPETVADGLAASVAWLKNSITYWADMIDQWKAQPNSFLSYSQLDKTKMDATPGGEPIICYWILPRDEALIIRVRPPEKYGYWNVEFGNYFWETMDYRRRLASTNCHYAHLQPDGELILVVSHEDLGYYNWLDPSGHSEGYITFRWILTDSYPVPRVEQVKVSALAESLPAGVRRVTPEQRRQHLAALRRGIVKRFRY